MKVFIITAGEYSSYRIVSVFSTLELAKKAQEFYEGVEIEEYDLDASMDFVNRGLKLFYVQMYKDGTVASAGSNNYLDCGEEHPDKKESFEPGKFHSLYGKKGFVWEGWAKSEEHAVKICNEKRIQYLATNPNPEGS